MPNLTVIFTNDLNESVQKGDTMYYVNTTDLSLANSEVEKYSSNIKEIGEITSINYTTKTIIATIQNSTPLPTSASFFLFGKDNRVNMSTLLGYYCDVEFSNNSTTQAELFSVGSEIFESSK